jgi:hypothetical protein
MTGEQARAQLREAMQAIEDAAPLAFAGDVAGIRRRVSWIVAGFAQSRVCLRCRQSFAIDEAECTRRAVRRELLPEVCPRCRMS